MTAGGKPHGPAPFFVWRRKTPRAGRHYPLPRPARRFRFNINVGYPSEDRGVTDGRLTKMGRSIHPTGDDGRRGMALQECAEGPVDDHVSACPCSFRA